MCKPNNAAEKFRSPPSRAPLIRTESRSAASMWRNAVMGSCALNFGSSHQTGTHIHTHRSTDTYTLADVGTRAHIRTARCRHAPTLGWAACGEPHTETDPGRCARQFPNRSTRGAEKSVSVRRRNGEMLEITEKPRKMSSYLEQELFLKSPILLCFSSVLHRSGCTRSAFDFLRGIMFKLL